jgi:acyl-CoA reductase-like NAD-dependent aldehyde dehydrogenase
MALNIINPANGLQIASLDEDSEETLNNKFDNILISKEIWKETSLENRVQVLKKFSDLLDQNKTRLSSILTSEVGKPINQSVNEINGARNRMAWLCGNAEKYLSDDWMVEEDGLGERIVYEPLGVVCNISAWNYPYLVGVNVIVPALLAGNGIMYKPSEYASLTGLEIQKLLLEAGLPNGVFEIAIGDGAVGKILLDLPFDGYYFTGSYNTGKYIYEKVSEKMVPCQLELGGKDPLYVTDDVEDVKSVAIGTADGAFYNNGQSCCAVERIYVQASVYVEYVESFVNEVNSWKCGEPTEDGVYIGALTRAAQIKVIENQIADAVGKGAKIVCGGKKIDKAGNYFEPTVLINVTNDMLVMQEESFGPIIGIMKVESDEEATSLMNDTAYGLTAAVYSSSQERAESMLSKINSGSGYWNCCDRVSPALPWSGRKHSGFGATLSHAGLRAFTKPKAYHLRGNWKK